MTKKEIVQDLGLGPSQTLEIVQRTFDAIIATLVAEGRIALRDFGVFTVRRTRPRTGRNPRTGATVPVPAQNRVSFKPGRKMIQQVRQADAARPVPAAPKTKATAAGVRRGPVAEPAQTPRRRSRRA
jgi:integration host factor subunit beta